MSSSTGVSTKKAPAMEARLGAMVFCRSIACLLGYPVQHDPTFTNRQLLDLFLQVIVTCTESDALWDFNMHDLSTVLAPLLDYAEAAEEAAAGMQDGGASDENHPLAHLEVRTTDWMQEKFTFGDASSLTEELDALTRLYSDEASWVKWFEFVRYTESIQDQGYGAHLRGLAWHPWVRTYKVSTLNMFPMEPSLAKQRFFATCRNLHGHLPASEAFKKCTTKFFKQRSAANKQRYISISEMEMMQYKTPEELADEYEAEIKAKKAAAKTSAWSNSTFSSYSGSPLDYSQKWIVPAEFTAAMSTPCPISARMTQLLEGSVAEPRDSNWHSNGAYC